MDNVQKNTSGFLTYDFIAAQTGVFPYLDPMTGDIVYELKHPDDLLTPEVLEQLKNLPITDDHPWELVNPDNAQEHVKGLTSDNAKILDNKLAGNGTVFDASLIGKILNNNKKECSLGFECKIVEESGEYKGQKYDRRQTNFEINHLAMVEKGRCGPDCSAKLDSADYAVQVRNDEDLEEMKKRHKRSDKQMKTVKLDGKEFEVQDEVAARLDALESDNQNLQKEVGKLEGKIDGKDDTIKSLKSQIDDLEEKQLSDEKLDEAVNERLTLLKDAELFLDDGYDIKGKSEREIKVDCIKSVNDDFNAEGRADEYVNARFDVLKEMLEDGEGSYGDKNLKFKKKDSSSRSDAIEKKRQKRLNMRGDE
jgi:hypothetical protein